MANSEAKWGSPEWRTHLRRSLAQRKRHGEKIEDIDKLIDYIEKKGPPKKKEAVKKAVRKTTPINRQSLPTGPGGVTVRYRSHRQRIL